MEKPEGQVWKYSFCCPKPEVLSGWDVIYSRMFCKVLLVSVAYGFRIIRNCKGDTGHKKGKTVIVKGRACDEKCFGICETSTSPKSCNKGHMRKRVRLYLLKGTEFHHSFEVKRAQVGAISGWVTPLGSMPKFYVF